MRIGSGFPLRSLLAGLLLAGLAYFSFSSLLSAKFFQDDYFHLLIAEKGAAPSTFLSTDIMLGVYYRPFGLLLWMAGFQAGGFHPLPYYVLNLLFHAANALLIGLLFKSASKDFPWWPASLVFFFFPFTLPALAWLSTHYDLAVTFFSLLSLLTLVLFRTQGKKTLYFLSLAAFAAALLSKESAMILPLAFFLIVLLFAPRKAQPALPSRTARSLCLLIPFLVLEFLYLLARGAVLGTGGFGPLPLRTGFEHTFSTLVHTLSLSTGIVREMPWLLIPLALLPFTGLLARIAGREHEKLPGRIILVGIFLAGVTLFSLSASLSHYGRTSSLRWLRILYLPSAGISILLSGLIPPNLLRKSTRVRVLFLLLCVLPLAGGTRLLCRRWTEYTGELHRFMEAVHEAVSRDPVPLAAGSILQVPLRNCDIALDASLKVFYPQYRDRCYFLLPRSRNLVFSTEELHRRSGRFLRYSTAYVHNPHNVGGRILGITLEEFGAEALQGERPEIPFRRLQLPLMRREKKW